MDRRTILGVLAGGLFALKAKGADQGANKLPIIGILHPGPAPNSLSINSILNGLRDLGYVDGKTVTIELRSAEGNPDNLPELAAELMKQRVDVLYAVGPAAVRTALDVAKGIPVIVMDLETDPVQVGWARSLARPGGNVTGMFLDHPALAGKWLELLREAAPGVRRIGVLWDHTTGTSQMQAARATATRLGLDLQVLEFHNSDDLLGALRSGARAGVNGLVALTSPITDRWSHLLADFAIRRAHACYKRPASMSYRPLERNQRTGAIGQEQPSKLVLQSVVHIRPRARPPIGGAAGSDCSFPASDTWNRTSTALSGPTSEARLRLRFVCSQERDSSPHQATHAARLSPTVTLGGACP